MKTLTTKQIENLENERVDILKNEQERHEGYSISYPNEDLEEDFLTGRAEALTNIVWNVVSELDLEEEHEDVEITIEEARISIHDSIETISEKILSV